MPLVYGILVELLYKFYVASDLVADFIESDGLIWFVQVKGFKLAPAPW